MDLLKKFDTVTIRTADLISEADRQFCQKEQGLYSDAVEGFYQIATLWMNMRAHQRAACEPGNCDERQKQKYLISHWWEGISVRDIIRHIFSIHRFFINTIVAYLNETYFLNLASFVLEGKLIPEEPSPDYENDEVDWSAYPPFVLKYDEIIAQILKDFNGRTFEEQAIYELLDGCHKAVWDSRSHSAKFEQKKNTVKILYGACGYGYYNGYEQWHVERDMKYVLKGLARFETDALGTYPRGINSLISDTVRLWYDLWEFPQCVKFDRIRLFKNGRMDIRFTSEEYARQFADEYFGTMD